LHPNEKVISDFYAAQHRFYAGEGAEDDVRALLAEDVVWHVPGRSAIAGDYRGWHDVRDYFARRRDKAQGTLRIEIRRTLAADDVVMQLAGGRAELGGKAHEWETVGVYRIVDGKIAECWLLPFDQYAFDEIWA
jgi:ketosteroid isomerase-like protein